MARSKQLPEDDSENTLKVSPTIWMPPTSKEMRNMFVQNLASQLVIEMVKKEGKALPDYADNAHKAATKLADNLGL